MKDELHKLIHSNLTVDSFQSQSVTLSVGLENMELVRIIVCESIRPHGIVLLICFLLLPFFVFLYSHFLI